MNTDTVNAKYTGKNQQIKSWEINLKDIVDQAKQLIPESSYTQMSSTP